MKKIVFILSALVGFLNTSAQTYFSADLESGIDSWTIVDSDGDGNNWSVVDFDDNEGSVLNSASYDNETGPLTPDNWIITPAINLASSIAPTLYWTAKAQDQSWANENYSVYVSTQSDVNALSSSSVSFTEVIGATNGYELRTLDLSSFNNETVYVAFRHHDVSDMFSFNVKDISVSEVLQEFVQHDISSSNYQI
ncbi:MAG: choice-of-anchor J domain-containing protein, partial [Flavobacteriales bacterium]|nr:choice-of-anchor J domain-containing protein [Flavobacteriales bacterium]